jgi:hypothetical protein
MDNGELLVDGVHVHHDVDMGHKREQDLAVIHHQDTVGDIVVVQLLKADNVVDRQIRPDGEHMEHGVLVQDYVEVAHKQGDECV